MAHGNQRLTLEDGIPFQDYVEKYSKVPYNVAYLRYYRMGWSIEEATQIPTDRRAAFAQTLTEGATS